MEAWQAEGVKLFIHGQCFSEPGISLTIQADVHFALWGNSKMCRLNENMQSREKYFQQGAFRKLIYIQVRLINFCYIFFLCPEPKSDS